MQQKMAKSVQPGIALALLCVAQFVNVLGVTVVIVALPVVGKALGLTSANLQWVVSAYALFFGSFLLLCGRAADLYGRRLFFRLGLGVFVVASFVCGVTNNLWLLVAARAVQGIGAAMVLPAALSLLTVIFPEGTGRDRAVGIWTAVAAGGGAAGFFLGGLVSESLGWEWVFFLNVPVGLLGIVLAPRLLPESRDARASRRLDMLGAACITMGLLLLIYGFTRAEENGFGLGTLGLLGLAVGTILAFLVVEARVENPLMPLRIWRSSRLTGSSLVSFALTSTTSAAAVIGTLYLQNILSYSPTATGLAYAPFSIAVVIGSLLGSRLVARVGPKWTMTVGLIAVAVAMLLSSRIAVTNGLPYLMSGIVVSGLGLGCAAVASTAAGVSAVGDDERGLASGLLNAAAQLGTAIGIAVLGTVAAARTGMIAGDEESVAAVVTGYQFAFLVAAGVAIVSAFIAFRLMQSAKAEVTGEKQVA